MRCSRNDSCAGPDRNTDDRTDSHADIDPRANANPGPDGNPNDRANIHSRADALTDPYCNPNTDPRPFTVAFFYGSAKRNPCSFRPDPTAGRHACSADAHAGSHRDRGPDRSPRSSPARRVCHA